MSREQEQQALRELGFGWLPAMAMPTGVAASLPALAPRPATPTSPQASRPVWPQPIRQPD